MSKTGFIVTFDGQGVHDGRIDVRDLAPALLSLGRLIDSANLIINGENCAIKVQVKAVAGGSFEVYLDAALTNWDYIKSLLDSSDVETVKKLLEWLSIIGSSTVGIVQLYRWLNGKKPDKVIREKDGAFVFELEGRRLVVPFEVMRLYQERVVNQEFSRLLDTLSSGSIEKINFISEEAPKHTPALTLTASDRQAFAIEEPEPEKL